MKKNFSTSALFIAAFAAFFSIALHVTPVRAATADDCAPSATDLKQISIIQNDPTLSYSDELKTELAARKKLLGTTISCAIGEATDLKTSLDAVSATSDTTNLQSQLDGKLNDAINFYNIELTKLGGVGISGSQAIAREVLSYRTGSYEPLADEIDNFMLWTNNQSLFTTAQARMGDTNRAVSFLLSATPNNDLQSAFAAAQSSFNNAESENQAAKSALMQLLPAGQSLSLIQQSLSSLSDTYQQFFTVSNLIKTLLPQ